MSEHRDSVSVVTGGVVSMVNRLLTGVALTSPAALWPPVTATVKSPSSPVNRFCAITLNAGCAAMTKVPALRLTAKSAPSASTGEA